MKATLKVGFAGLALLIVSNAPGSELIFHEDWIVLSTQCDWCAIASEGKGLVHLAAETPTGPTSRQTFYWRWQKGA